MGSAFGGPTGQQKQAATNTLNTGGTLAAQGTANQGVINNTVSPFYANRAANGLPYYTNMVDSTSGSTAQAFAPARAALNRRLGAQPGLPSGFREGARSDLDEAQAQAFDQTALGAQAAQEQAKQAGVAGLAQVNNPLPYYSGALGANQSVMNANLRAPGWGGVAGGAAGGLASAIPF
jgi:hypothetical protein